MECDILIPAALENVINAENAPRVKAKIVGRGAGIHLFTPHAGSPSPKNLQTAAPGSKSPSKRFKHKTVRPSLLNLLSKSENAPDPDVKSTVRSPSEPVDKSHKTLKNSSVIPASQLQLSPSQLIRRTPSKKGGSVMKTDRAPASPFTQHTPLAKLVMFKVSCCFTGLLNSKC